MKQEDFAHLLRAAADAAEDNNIIVIGSQAILGTYSEDELPPEACLSIEVDIAFLDDPDELKAIKVDGAIGEDSRFHETFGIYGQGVGLAVADLRVGGSSAASLSRSKWHPPVPPSVSRRTTSLLPSCRPGVRWTTTTPGRSSGPAPCRVSPCESAWHSSTPSRPSAAGSWRRSTGSSRADRSSVEQSR